MSAELPPVDPLTAPWWDATREHRLLLQRCSGCGALQHHPRTVCTGCGATEGLGWVDASGIGRLDCATEVHRAPAPGVEVPYVVARVRLAEGPLLLTHLVGTAPQDAYDVDLEVGWRPLPDGRNLPVFHVRGATDNERGN
jgi:uncharacterized OB-fold protein